MMADLAIGIMGLASTIQACISLYTAIATARTATSDIEDQITFIRQEQIRFLLWCEIMGFCDLAKVVESRLRQLKQHDKYSDEDQNSRNHASCYSMTELGGLVLQPGSAPTFLQGHFERVIQGMYATLREVEVMLNGYGYSGPSSNDSPSDNPPSKKLQHGSGASKAYRWIWNRNRTKPSSPNACGEVSMRGSSKKTAAIRTSTISLTSPRQDTLRPLIVESTIARTLPLVELHQLTASPASFDPPPSRQTSTVSSVADTEVSRAATTAAVPVTPIVSSTSPLQTNICIKGSQLSASQRLNRSIKWSLVGRERLTGHVGKLRAFNDGLTDILRLLDRRTSSRLQRWIETAVATDMSAADSYAVFNCPCHEQDQIPSTSSSQLRGQADAILPPCDSADNVIRREELLRSISLFARRAQGRTELIDSESEVGANTSGICTTDHARDLKAGMRCDKQPNGIKSETTKTCVDDHNHKTSINNHTNRFGKLPNEQDLLLNISAKDIEINDPHPISPSSSSSSSSVQSLQRCSGMYGTLPVMIEWCHLSSQLSSDQKVTMEYKISALAVTLQQCSQIPAFQVLRCMGYFLAKDTTRYGLVFARPPSPLDSRPPTTLRDKLMQDFTKKTGVELEQRLRLAARLARAVYQFFATGWLHKNIRGHNILLFESGRRPPDCRRNDLEAYLAGFGLSRRDTRHLHTEALASVLNSSAEEKEWQLYLSPRRRITVPDSNGNPPSAAEDSEALSPTLPVRTATRTVTTTQANQTSQYSSYASDAYSLGIVLLEIALWCPVIRLCSRSTTVNDFQKTVSTAYESKLAFTVGHKYSAVVKWCLEVDMEKFLIVGDDDVDGRDGQVASQRFLEAFELSVVTELENLIN